MFESAAFCCMVVRIEDTAEFVALVEDPAVFGHVAATSFLSWVKLQVARTGVAALLSCGAVGVSLWRSLQATRARATTARNERERSAGIAVPWVKWSATKLQRRTKSNNVEELCPLSTVRL